MEQYLLDNIPRYHKLVSAFRPKPARRPAPDAPAPVPDMLVTARLRPLLPDDGILPPALFPRLAEPGVLDVHELRQPPRGPALLRVWNPLFARELLLIVSLVVRLPGRPHLSGRRSHRGHLR